MFTLAQEGKWLQHNKKQKIYVKILREQYNDFKFILRTLRERKRIVLSIANLVKN